MYKGFVNKQAVKVIILVGHRDFGRCPIASQVSVALWPIAGKPVLERLLVHLANQGIRKVTICSSGNDPLLWESIHVDNRLDIKFLTESLPVGTAGCIRDAAGGETDALFLVFPPAIISAPDVDTLLEAHRKGRADLTLILNPAQENSQRGSQSLGIYVCNASILQHIPKEGYFDIKEGLIPEMLRSGKTVRAVTLLNHVGNFRDREEYLCAIADYLVNGDKTNDELQLLKKDRLRTIWAGPNTTVDPDARLYGPVAIMRNACVEKGAVILGPTLLGRNVNIGQNSIVTHSVLWDNARVGNDCEVQQCVVDYHTVIQSNSILEEKFVSRKPEKILETLVNRTLVAVKNNTSRLQSSLQRWLDKINEKLPDSLRLHRLRTGFYLAAGLLIVAFFWSYWPGLIDVWNVCRRSDEYSSGLLVPFLAVYILWSRRTKIAEARIKPSMWGLFAFVVAQAFRLFGLFFMYGSAERLSIVLSIAALVLLLFGWQFLRSVSTILLFLLLMLPWPIRVQTAMSLPLQSWATSSAVFCLEMIGYEVIQEGNIIRIGQATVAVAEACNGLRMITAFFVIIGLVVLLVRRTWWEKLFLLVSCLPIAFLCNTVRLAITAIAFTVLQGERWEKIFHDFGGYAMMPLALAVAVAELWLLTKLVIPPVKKEAVIIRTYPKT